MHETRRRAYSEETVCNVTIDAKSSRELSIVLQGAMVGQGSLILEGKSALTLLTGKDSVQISVRPRTPDGVKQAPGIAVLQVLVLAVLGGVTVVLTRQ